MYEFDGDRWVLAQQLTHSGAGRNQGFGNNVEANGGVLLGATGIEVTPEGRGSVYHFEQDADGTLTIFDFLAFFNAFDAGDPAADFDGDGELTIFDFQAFRAAFDAGCE